MVSRPSFLVLLGLEDFQLKTVTFKVSVKENEVPTEKIPVAQVVSLQRQVIAELRRPEGPPSRAP